MQSIQWTREAEPSSVGELRAHVVEFATEHDVPAPQVSELALGASEALTNAVQHAFAPGAAGLIGASVSIERGRARVVLRITDDGVGMTLRPDSPGFGPGLGLISRTAEDFDVQPGQDGVGTTVTMSFAVRQWEPGTAAAETAQPANQAPPAAATARRRPEGAMVAFVSVALVVWSGAIYALIRVVL